MKKRVQKVKCHKCRTTINVDEEISLGNFDTVGSIKYIWCPRCGDEIIIQ